MADPEAAPALEVVPDDGPKGPTGELFGETFALGEISQWGLMEWAESAERTDANLLAAYAVVMRLLRECISEQDWPRFSAVARKNNASTHDLMPLVVQAVTAQRDPDRPTGRPSDSSDGPLQTGASSESGSVSSTLTLLAGRPDLQSVVRKAEAAARASA